MTTPKLPADTAALARPQACPRRTRRALGSLCLLPLLFGLAVAGPPTAAAQKNKKLDHVQVTPVRIAEGTVVNGGGKPIEGAVVYLENPTSLDVKSYLSDAGGHFHFAHLAPQTDYEVWAEQNNVQSKHKFISQFSSHTHFDFTLKITKDRHKFLGIF